MLRGKDEQLDEAVVIIKELSADEEARQLEEYRMKALRDYNALVNARDKAQEAERKAKEQLRKAKEQLKEQSIKAQAEGKAEGRAEGKKETAKKLLQIQMPPEQVADVTGLPIEDILQL